MVRFYGSAPYKVAVIHGGPGAAGSLGPLGEGLSRFAGIMEPIQSQYTIEALVSELEGQIQTPVIMAGHSWGAWLSVLFAARHPEKVKKLVLIGSGPFDERYVHLIGERRLANLDERERREYLEAAANNDGQKLSGLTYKSDNVDIIPFESGMPFDETMFARIWNEASSLRREGKLLSLLRDIKCPVYVVHGDSDPHPVEGVAEPLSEAGITPDVFVLSRCGHSPFLEKHAKDEFYSIMENIIDGCSPVL